MTRYALRHLTRYAYGAPVDLGYHLLRLTPAETARQRLVEHRIAITPAPNRVADLRDHFGNGVAHVSIERRHDSFEALLEATVEVDARDNTLFVPGPPWEQVRDAVRDDGFPEEPAVAEFAYGSPLAPADARAGAYAARSFTPGRPVAGALRDLTARIRRDFEYLPGTTTVSTPVATVLATRRGVCQDFAHLMIAGLRHLGLPARYVSGYLRTYPPEDAGQHRGFDASHAWVSAWCGAGQGWLELDPTNDLVVNDEHIVLAYGRDFEDVSPLKGVILGGGAHAVEVEVTVTPLAG